MAPNQVHFRYDSSLDIAFVTPHWHVASAADVALWFLQYEAFFGRFRRQIDVVLLLGDFKVSTQVGSLWGEARGRLGRRFFRHSVRVHTNRRVHVYLDTSGVRYDAGTHLAASEEEAVALVQRLRAGEVPAETSEENTGRFFRSFVFETTELAPRRAIG